MTVAPPCNFEHAASARCPCGDCAMPTTTCLWAMDLHYFSNLYNFPLNKIVEAAEPVNPYENLTGASRRPHGGLAEAARKRGYGQDTGSVDASHLNLKGYILDIEFKLHKKH